MAKSNIPHPGQLRHRVSIGKTENAVNENGFPVSTDTVLYTVWAGIEDASSKWFYASDADNAEKGLVFMIRWIDGIVPGMWIKWENQKHIITQTGAYDFKKRYLKLTTQRLNGGN